MKAFIGVTDFDWFTLLGSKDHLDEINFWQPSGRRTFKALAPGELFLFKLHSPRNFIVGGGVFTHSTILPISLAWEAFGEGNGVPSLQEMRQRTTKYRKIPPDRIDYKIGCIVLTQPFFLPESLWIPVPTDWKPNIVQGKTYDLSTGLGAKLWTDLESRLPMVTHETPTARYGSELAARARLGQGAFRVLVTDAYERRCAITGERVLPVLEAAHVRPYADGGLHQISNGLLLRRDLHTLFDRGYLTVTPGLNLEVSRKIKEEFENGREYYALHGIEIRSPESSEEQLAPANIEWHNNRVFLG